MRRIVILILAAALAGCAGPRPEPPPTAAVSPPASWRTETAPGGEVDQAWWRSFGDPVLSAVVERALANNVDIASAAARVEEARGQFRLARAQQFPNLVAQGSGGEQRALNAFGIGTDQAFGQAGLAVSYDADLFGRLANASAGAKAALLATEAARDNVRLAVAATAAGGYIVLRSLDARLAVLRDTLAARADSLKLAQRRADAGYAPALDLRQAEAAYHATEQLIPATELAIARQEDGLSLLLGDSPRAIERGAALDQLTVPAATAGLPSALLRRRPDIEQAEQQVVAADRSLDSVRAAFMPSIQLNGSGGLVASTLLSSPVGLFAIGGSVLQPILDAGRLKAQQGIAAARRDQAAFAYRKTVLNAFREVDDALAAVQRTAEQEQAIAAQREALSQALVLARKRYRAGYSPYLEQLDAQRSLLDAEISLVQSRADRFTAMVSLYQSLGGGWRPEIKP